MKRNIIAAGLLLGSCAAATMAIRAAEPALSGADRVDHAALTSADSEANAGNWYSYSRTWDEQRYSPLTQINDQNVSQLGLAWYDDLETQRGVQGSPLVIDGVLYNVSIYNIVTAYDGKTGRKLWTYDPKVEKIWARWACCGPSARGIAAWKGKIYIGALDGRLIAIDAKTGKEVWVSQTFEPNKDPYSITGAPRVYDGKVVIGNGGGDYGSRGFVTAWDAESGKQLWKFYIVPTDPAKGPDGEASDSAMKIAAPTWHGKFWEAGGGGNAWDSFAYDPKLNLVYIGTGNGAPHMWHFRSEGKGDNLFLCSIVAVDGTTGEYKWHYQMVPEEDWDYTCTQPMVLADLPIKGKTRQVIMQAPKNGFFYVIDRKTGELISGNNYLSHNTWASHIDMATGRPVLQPGAHNTTTPHLMMPAWMAAHTWHPMSFSPKTGLVYFGAQEQGSIYARLEDGKYKYQPGMGRTNSGEAFGGGDPELRKKLQQEAKDTEKGYLLAWNPATQSEAWRVDYGIPGSGGVLATAGNLVIQPTIKRTVAIYRADNGQKLWEMNVDQAGIAGPITYAIDGEQYIAVNVGWGGSPVMNLPSEFRIGSAKLLVFKLGGTAKLPPMPPAGEEPYQPRMPVADDVFARGAALYGENCSKCHGDDAVGGVKDLRKMSKSTHDAFMDIVLGGTLEDKGMASFKGQITEAQAKDIYGYLVKRTQDDW